MNSISLNYQVPFDSEKHKRGTKFYPKELFWTCSQVSHHKKFLWTIEELFSLNFDRSSLVVINAENEWDEKTPLTFKQKHKIVKYKKTKWLKKLLTGNTNEATIKCCFQFWTKNEREKERRKRSHSFVAFLTQSRKNQNDIWS